MTKKESLEYNATFNRENTIDDLKEVLLMITRISSEYKNIKVLINFNLDDQEDAMISGDETSLPLLREYFTVINSYNKPDNIYILLHGIPTEIVALMPPSSNWQLFCVITSIDHIRILASIDVKYFCILFYVLPDNVDQIIQIYNEMINSKVEVIEFVNFKTRVPHNFSNYDIEKLQKFYQHYLEKDYYYDEITDEVYNKAKHLQVKGFRSIRKYLMKYSYSNAYYNVVQSPKLRITRVTFDKYFIDARHPDNLSLDEFEAIVTSEENTIIPIGVKCANCPSCSLNGECSNKSDIIYEATPYFCAEAKFMSMPIQILKNIPQKDIKEFASRKLA